MAAMAKTLPQTDAVSGHINSGHDLSEFLFGQISGQVDALRESDILKFFLRKTKVLWNTFAKQQSFAGNVFIRRQFWLICHRNHRHPQSQRLTI
jgi:hypothetical protein